MGNEPHGKQAPDIGEAQRDYPHSSGDRNTKKSESDWPEFEGGKQRNADPDGARRDERREG